MIRMLAIYDPTDRFMGRRGELPIIIDPATRMEFAREASAICRESKSVIIGWNTKTITDRAGARLDLPILVWPQPGDMAPSTALSMLRSAAPMGDTLIIGGLRTFRDFAHLCDQHLIYRAALDSSGGTGTSLYFPEDIT
jgi:hypothetical protein